MSLVLEDIYRNLSEIFFLPYTKNKSNSISIVIENKQSNTNNRVEINPDSTLVEIVDNNHTDKNTVHSYLELYETLLRPKKTTAKNVLEVGIDRGGSIRLWADYFINARVFGVDIMPSYKVWEKIKHDNRIVLYTNSNAYDWTFVKTNFIDKNIQFDFILDDGPHTLESMIQFIHLYSPLLTDKGILIIEDVQKWEWIDILHNQVSIILRPYVKCYDLRRNKGRYDDIVFTINKSIYNT